jgi:hypothetical protein
MSGSGGRRPWAECVEALDDAVRNQKGVLLTGSFNEVHDHVTERESSFLYPQGRDAAFQEAIAHP